MFDRLADDHWQNRRRQVLTAILQGLQRLLQLLHGGTFEQKAMGAELQATHDEVQFRT
ncbi:hypothetical protein D3C87_2150620 [compost metagenome]